MKRILPALSALLLLGACTVGPDFVPPVANTGASYTGPGDQALGGEQTFAPGKAPDEEWWKQFQSPALNDLIARAQDKNRDLTAARARLTEALEEIRAARGALLPQVSLGAAVGEQNYSVGLRTPLSVTLPAFTYYAAAPNISYAPDLFGGQKRTIERAEALADYQRFELEAEMLSLYANIASESLRNAAARAQIADLNDVIAGDQRNVSLVQSALDAGSATRTQLLTVQSQLATDRTLLPDFQQEEALSRHALAALSGEPAGAWAMPAMTLDGFTLPKEIPASLPSELIHQRPDILAAEAELHMASAAIGIATANLYPQLSLSATLTRQALTPDALFSASPNLWNIAAGLTAPLFNGGSLSAKRRAAIAAYQAALADYEKTVLAAFAEVADNLQALANDGEKVAAERAAGQAASDALDLSRRSFEAGNSGILDVIDAERRYGEARLGLSRAVSQRLLDTVELYVSLGGVKLPADGNQQEEKGTASGPCCSY